MGACGPSWNGIRDSCSVLSEEHYGSIVPRFRGSLTLADAIVITSMQGIKQTAEFVSIVDP